MVVQVHPSFPSWVPDPSHPCPTRGVSCRKQEGLWASARLQQASPYPHQGFFSFMLPVTWWLGQGHLHGRDHEDH